MLQLILVEWNYFLLFLIATVEYIPFMLRIIDDITQKEVYGPHCIQNPHDGVFSGIGPYIIGKDHVLQIMCFINCRTNVEKNSTRYVMIECIMIDISGVNLF